MRFAITITQDGTISGLAEATELVFWDTATGVEERLPTPAADRSTGRRLIIIEQLLASAADIFCAVPKSLCPVSYTIAQAAGMRFLPVEAGTALQLIEAHGDALAIAARPDLPSDWIADVPPSAQREAAEGSGWFLNDTTAHALINRLKRVEGQARGVCRLIEERQSSEAILTQLSAMRSAVNAVSVAILAENLAHCLAAAGEDEGLERLEAAKRAFQYMN